MLMRSPAVEAEQHGAIVVEDLAKVVMAWTRRWLSKERLIPREATRHIAHADDGPCAFHSDSMLEKRREMRDKGRVVKKIARLSPQFLVGFATPLSSQSHRAQRKVPA